MSSKIKIAIVGLGGVGGYYGGKLASHYFMSKDIEIIFVAKKETADLITTKGFKLITASGEEIIQPHIVTDNPKNIGPIDVFIICVKNYDLENSLALIKTCVTENTTILPLLNGVDSSEKIKTIFPHAQILKGGVYIVSKLKAPGVVEESGKTNQLFFGSELHDSKDLSWLDTIFKNAHINSQLTESITQTIWQKYMFVSPIATITSLLNIPIGAILKDKDHRMLLTSLIIEIETIAKAKNILLSENIVEETLIKMSTLPYETTSSMHTDFINRKKTEIDSLPGYVVKSGKELSIKTPCHDNALVQLQIKLMNN